jgi:hypothetical protein
MSRRERRESGALRRDSRRQVVPDRLDRYRVPDVLEERVELRFCLDHVPTEADDEGRSAPRDGKERRALPLGQRGARREEAEEGVRVPKATEQRTERCGDDRRGAEIGAREIRVEDRDERHQSRQSLYTRNIRTTSSHDRCCTTRPRLTSPNRVFVSILVKAMLLPTCRVSNSVKNAVPNRSGLFAATSAKRFSAEIACIAEEKESKVNLSGVLGGRERWAWYVPSGSGRLRCSSTLPQHSRPCADTL